MVTALICAQPGCAGTIEDGYCIMCGISQAGSPSAAAPESARLSSSSSSHVAGRSGLGSAAISSRGGLGAGLVEVPPIQGSDPAKAVLIDPQLSEGKRFCGACAQPVGRGTASRPGRAEGFCRTCGARFDFRPRLQPGELIAGQYEVLGCLAHGGLGWIYLARDKNVSDRWVVLKGLLDSGDADAQAAALAERRFLAEVEHPSIVRIYNFVQHPDCHTGDLTGYIVMEYVGGRSLRQILLEQRFAGQSLPVAHALAYAIEILPALGYLHRVGLLYCDFKPDNVIQVEEQLKLIDLGGVRRMDDELSPIYGTVGYQAPEIAAAGPSVSSDLYTVGRALAVLTFEFSGYSSAYRHALPDQDSVPVLAANESFYRALRRATSADPGERFASAAQMAEQLTGVLREVLSTADGTPRPVASRSFTPELRAIGSVAAAGHDRQPGHPAVTEIAAGLPAPLVDRNDPASGYLATLTTLSAEQLADTLQSAISASTGTEGELAASAEAQLALARVRIALGDAAGVLAALEPLLRRELADWRVTWYRGVADVLAGRLELARLVFDAVCAELPGELAPKLALGLIAEAVGDNASAARYLRVVWSTDPSCVSAAFGLARVSLTVGDRASAVKVLSQVPETSSHHLAAQIAAVRALITVDGPANLSAADLADAAARLGKLRLDEVLRHSLTAEVLRAGLTVLSQGGTAGHELMGYEATDTGLRVGLEGCYRALARLSATRTERYALVEAANDVRPRTLV